jgi:peptide/nickel transport system ATP-binding protein
MPVKRDEDLILRVEGLKKYFPVSQGLFKKVSKYVKAVNDVSFSIKIGQTFGLVGESGCGKTTTARVLLRAIEPTDGRIYFKVAPDEMVNIAQLDKKELKRVRKNMQMIFQDPYSSLNPRLPVLDLIAEPLKAYGWKKKDYKERVAELLELVGLNPGYMSRYPHAFSGGQRQRIGIARALALNPALVVADEPVSALDVSVQAQILNLLQELQEKLGLTYLFIAHDLSVIRYICDRVAVMYLGRLVEVAETEELYSNPLHPYTATLLSAVPEPDPELDWLQEEVQGEVEGLYNQRDGCSFAPRCKYVIEECLNVFPELQDLNGHQIACHRFDELRLKGVG